MCVYIDIILTNTYRKREIQDPQQIFARPTPFARSTKTTDDCSAVYVFPPALAPGRTGPGLVAVRDEHIRSGEEVGTTIPRRTGSWEFGLSLDRQTDKYTHSQLTMA